MNGACNPISASQCCAGTQTTFLKTAVTNQASKDSDENRVVPLRPGIRIRHDAAGQPEEPVGDLTKYERPEGTDDYRHRMMVNLAAFAALVLLAFVGIWLADQLANMRKNQDCVLSGRRNCAGDQLKTGG